MKTILETIAEVITLVLILAAFWAALVIMN